MDQNVGNQFSEEELIAACNAANIDVASQITVSIQKQGSRISEPPHAEDVVTVSHAGSDSPIDFTNRGSKRSRFLNKSNWKSEKEKVKRMKGESYLTYESNPQSQRTLTKPKSERTMGPKCTSKNCTRTSRRSCSEFSDNARRDLFETFWQTMDWNAKKSYVKSLVDQIDPKFARTPGSSNKTTTNVFYLKLNGLKRQVCRNMFVGTLGITLKELRGWIKSPGTQYRTVKPRSTPRLSQSKMYAMEYLDNLPMLPSHYCRARTDKLYLEPVFKNKIQLYKAYREKCEELQQAPLCHTVFMELVSEKKISLFKPKKDKCDICCGYEVKTVSEEDWKAHQLKKQAARAEKVNDKQDANVDKCHVICVDVQAVLLAPMMNASALYYKTMLMVHNYSIYDLKSHDAKCFLWNESDGDLVASTFATCLLNYMEEMFQDQLPIIVYSDGCTNQNRNAVLSNALLYFAMKSGKTVYQKYLEKGHTQNEVDSVHATIERKLKGMTIYLPSDYAGVCQSARENPKPYGVKTMKHSDFINYSTAQNLKYPSIRPGNKPGDPTVTDIRQLRYNPTGTIDYKLEHNGDWTALPRNPKKISTRNFPKLYKTSIPIAKRKYQDLLDLLSVIPAEHHDFYKNLLHLS